MPRFEPAPYLRNGHVQTLVNSMRLRRPLVRRRARRMLAAAEERILDCGEQVRLMGLYSAHRRAHARDLVVLIHGWEGSGDSSYLVSAAGCLYDRGFDVFRLNLRDHGPTHHLNRGLFHACRLREVAGAMQAIQSGLSFRRLFLAGYSLGGNFALRLGNKAPTYGLDLERIAAVCPVIDPDHALTALTETFPLYHWYFLRKWRRSLEIKQRYYPGLIDFSEIKRHNSIRKLTDYFAPRYTPFASGDAYLAGYSIAGNRLSGLRVPSTIIASRDDPLIPEEDLNRMHRPYCLSIEQHRYGGHCGFIKDGRLKVWTDRRLARLFGAV
jgi:hypothetical protein